MSQGEQMQKSIDSPGKPEGHEEFEVDMVAFRKEITELKRKVRAGEEVDGGSGLLKINLRYLTELDARKWNTFDLIKLEDICYGSAYDEDVRNSGNKSREYFLAFIRDRLTSLWLKKQLEEHKVGKLLGKQAQDITEGKNEPNNLRN